MKSGLSAAPAAARPIELKTSELFHRHKRNLMLACSITIVLALTKAQDGVVIPGTSDAAIPTQAAFAFLLLSVIYLGAEFYTEYFVIRARNSSAVADLNNDELDLAFARHAQALQTASSTIEDTTSALAAAAGELRPYIKSAFTGAPANYEGLGQAIEAPFNASIGMGPRRPSPEDVAEIAKSVREYLTDRELQLTERKVYDLAVAEGTVHDVQDYASRLAASIATYTAKADDMRSGFTTLSKSVYRAQRIGLTFLDGVVPGAMAAIAAIACVTKIFPGLVTWLAQLVH